MVILKNIFFCLILFLYWWNTDGLRISHRRKVSPVCPPPTSPTSSALFCLRNENVHFSHAFFVIMIFKLVPAPFTLHVQSLGWSPDYLVNHLTDHKSRVTPNSLQGFYLSCLQMFGNTDAKIEDGNLSVGSCHTLTVCVCVHAGWDVVVRACVSVSSARDCVFAMKTTQH